MQTQFITIAPSFKTRTHGLGFYFRTAEEVGTPGGEKGIVLYAGAYEDDIKA